MKRIAPRSGSARRCVSECAGAASCERTGHDQEGPMPNFTLTTLYNFDGSQTSVSGKNPRAGLIMDAAGNLFGTTSSGGANGDGTVFEIARNGSGYASAPTVLVSFNSGANGVDSLTLDAAGNLIGTTSAPVQTAWARRLKSPRPQPVMPVPRPPCTT